MMLCSVYLYLCNVCNVRKYICNLYYMYVCMYAISNAQKDSASVGCEFQQGHQNRLLLLSILQLYVCIYIYKLMYNNVM